MRLRAGWREIRHSIIDLFRDKHERMADVQGADRRRYRKVYTRLWTNREFQALNDSHKVAALYLLSGPQTNRIGLFRLSLGEAGEDLGVSVAMIRTRVDHVCRSFDWHFDHGSKVIWIPTWWTFNPPAEKSNNFKGALSDLGDVPKTPLITKFFNNFLGIPVALHEILRSRAPFEQCSDTVVTQEQETRQDKQEQETSTALARGDARVRFERFWDEYPRKVGKDAAWREWLKRSPDDDLTDQMIAAVRHQRASAQWVKQGGEFIPHPRTWLHQGRWQDEPDDLPFVSSKTVNVLRGLQ